MREIDMRQYKVLLATTTERMDIPRSSREPRLTALAITTRKCRVSAENNMMERFLCLMFRRSRLRGGSP